MATTITGYLISAEWMHNNLPMAKDLSIEDLKPFIVQAMDFQCQTLLGSDLYKRLMDGVAANDLSADELFLAKLIRPALGYYVMWNALPFLNWKATPKAVMQGTSDTATPAGISEINYLKGYFKSNAEFYSQRVKDYLCANPGLFPQYNSNTFDDMFPDQRNSYGPSNAIYISSGVSDALRAYYSKDPNFTS